MRPLCSVNTLLIAYIIMKITYNLLQKWITDAKIYHSFFFLQTIHLYIFAKNLLNRHPGRFRFYRWGYITVQKVPLNDELWLWLGNLLMTSYMKVFSALLALCEGNPSVTPHKGQWREALKLSLICAWTNAWANDCDAGDSRRHGIHYNVTAKFISNTHRLIWLWNVRDMSHCRTQKHNFGYIYRNT